MSLDVSAAICPRIPKLVPSIENDRAPRHAMDSGDAMRVDHAGVDVAVSAVAYSVVSDYLCKLLYRQVSPKHRSTTAQG